MGLWKKIEISTLEDPPAKLEAQDNCYYARDYVSGGNWQSSEANRLVLNLKKSASKRLSFEWPHKLDAIKQFANELFKVIPPQSHFAFIPTSTRLDDPNHDPRWELLQGELGRIHPTVKFHAPIIREVSCAAVHRGGQRPSMEAIRATLGWVGFDGTSPGSIVLIDDVITAGKHFKVCQSMIAEKHPTTHVAGVFWARTIWPEQAATLL